MRIDTLSYNNVQTQGARRRSWLQQHSPQHLRECAALVLRALELRPAHTSHSTLVLGAGACTEVPLADLARRSDDVILADLDLLSMEKARAELASATMRKATRLVTGDLTGGISPALNRLLERQPWQELISQGAGAVFDAAAQCLDACPVADPPVIEGLYSGECGVVISSLTLTQLFSYPLLDLLDHIQQRAPAFVGEQERHYRYQEAAQSFRTRVIRAHLRLLRTLIDVGGLVVLLSDVRGFAFNSSDAEQDTAQRRTIPLVPRVFPDLVRDTFDVVEERRWEWITDL
ncbi:MAG TPA: hypothetical protein VGT44_18535, partial [Ktedonobacteraceae bacterium]|nr:hypothetical protein [Ktedonobacteraceae bacterium]